jgi:hypothetical protein
MDIPDGETSWPLYGYFGGVLHGLHRTTFHIQKGRLRPMHDISKMKRRKRGMEEDKFGRKDL